MPEDTIGTIAAEAAGAATEVQPTWRENMEANAIPPDAEDEGKLEEFYGKDWKTVLGMEETKDDTNGGGSDGVPVVTAGDSANGTVDTSTVSPADGVGADAGTAGAEGVPVVEAASQSPAGTDGGRTPAADDELKQLAELGRQWKTAFATDPKAAIASLLNSPTFSQEDKLELFKQTQQTAEQTAVTIDPAKYEAASDFEKALLPSLDWMRGGRNEVAQALAVRDKDIQHTFVEAQAANAKMDAICEFLGLELPKHDIPAIFKHFDSTPEGTLQDAVAKVYREAIIKAARVEKQKRADRPSTPRTVAGSSEPAKITSMMEAWEQAGIELGAAD